MPALRGTEFVRIEQSVENPLSLVKLATATAKGCNEMGRKGLEKAIKSLLANCCARQVKRAKGPRRGSKKPGGTLPFPLSGSMV